jgi:hypothetical protein
MLNSVLLGAEGIQQMPLEGSAINCSQSLASMEKNKTFSHLNIIFLFLRCLNNSEYVYKNSRIQ